MHVSRLFLHIKLFGFQHGRFHTLFTQKLDERLIFRHTFIGTEQQQSSFFLFLFIIRSHFGFCISKQPGSEIALDFYYLLHPRTEKIKQLIITFWNGTRYDQGGTRIVNQYGVNLVHDGIIVYALYQIFG
ncbi:hypothetical protein DSECCO2_634300 [anaerobic digester metagenome]